MISHKTPTAQTQPGGNPPSPALRLPGDPSLTLTLADGTELTLNNYPTNLAEAVDTAGADGTEKLLAQSFFTLAQQLKDQGKIDEDQFQKIRDLGTQGFAMARTTGQLELALRQSKGNPQIYAQRLSQLVFRGKQKEFSQKVNQLKRTEELETFTRKETAQHIQSNLQEFRKKYTLAPQQKVGLLLDANLVNHSLDRYYRQMSDRDLQTIVNNRNALSEIDGRTMGRFMATYEMARRSGALNDPAIKKVVEKNVIDIIRITSLVDYTGKKGGSSRPATGILNTKSDTICTTGHGESKDQIVCRKKS
jgi:hypothetical protein